MGGPEREVVRATHVCRRLDRDRTNRTKRAMTLIVSFFLIFAMAGTCGAFDFGSVVRDVEKAVKTGADAIEKGVKQVLPEESTAPETKPAPKQEAAPPAEPQVQSVSAAAAPAPGGSVFAAEPIQPAAPPASRTTFVAGDHIYGMLKAGKPWKALLGSSDYLILYFIVDGEEKIYRTVGLKRQDLLEQDYFIIDIAPDPAGMTNYADRDIIFPEKDGYRFGPELFTKYLSELAPGNHRIELQVKAYGEVFASGAFTISGDDFSGYAALVEKIKGSSGAMVTMPRVGMTDGALQGQMISLLRTGGWPPVRRLLIVDKDWWINRVSGGDSPIASRHIEAAAAAPDGNGGYYFCHITFSQPKLITGAWGDLEIIKTGEKKTIPEENIDK